MRPQSVHSAYRLGQGLQRLLGRIRQAIVEDKRGRVQTRRNALQEYDGRRMARETRGALHGADGKSLPATTGKLIELLFRWWGDVLRASTGMTPRELPAARGKHRSSRCSPNDPGNLASDSAPRRVARSTRAQHPGSARDRSGFPAPFSLLRPGKIAWQPCHPLLHSTADLPLTWRSYPRLRARPEIQHQGQTRKWFDLANLPFEITRISLA